ncbi:hypothetical protein MKK75_06230 [Methylobacterium sp. J-030]|uniref:hypothetical protein n=1 Tax=Methylobacterium sp. J-030 TaxID=2836627 RepID=UPI001FBB54B1|nr:hypothetical protein [Methylobacterium sp. J-030]MCJ2068410.1 hypothetical protein [Methylobacterium sp. J-030]
MAEVHPLSRRFSHEGAQRLVEALEQTITANTDLGPRWPQIQSLGLSLQQLTRDLEQEADRMAFKLDATPEVEAFRASLYQLAEAFSRLGVIAQAYPSAT